MASRKERPPRKSIDKAERTTAKVKLTLPHPLKDQVRDCAALYDRAQAQIVREVLEFVLPRLIDHKRHNEAATLWNALAA